MKNFNSIENQIIKVLEECNEEAIKTGRDERTYWTKLIKTELCNLGKKHGFKTAANGIDGADNIEWLYDLVWYVESDGKNYESQRLINIPLVVESEWDLHINQIKYDFEKLLVARAEHRLMISEVCKERKKPVLKCLKESVKNFPLGTKGDRYLIALYISENKRFKFKSIVKH